MFSIRSCPKKLIIIGGGEKKHHAATFLACLKCLFIANRLALSVISFNLSLRTTQISLACMYSFPYMSPKTMTFEAASKNGIRKKEANA